MPAAGGHVGFSLDPVNFSSEEISRFWEKVSFEGPIPDQQNPHYKGLEACHVWIACRNSGGYGSAWAGKRVCLAHRVAWALENGFLDSGFQVLHKCDNPSCVNARHLFLGDNDANHADKMAKGRANAVRGETHHFRTNPELISRGSDHWFSKLTEEKVLQMRVLHFEEKLGFQTIAARFSISESCARNVILGRTWSHYQEGLPDKKPVPKVDTRGSGNVFATLDEEKVQKIRRIAALGQFTNVQIGEMFGVQGPAIGKIVNRRTWRHID